MVVSLCPADIARYQTDGYLVLPLHRHGLVDDIATVQDWTSEIFRWNTTKGEWLIYEETSIHGERQLLGTEKLIDYHHGMRSLICADATFALLEQLTGRQVCLFKDEVAWKLPGGNGAVPHIDQPAYGHMAPEFVEIMMAVDAHNSRNGCLQFVAGSHLQEKPVAADGRVDQNWAATQVFTPIHLNAGDIVIFGHALVHQLDPNCTDKPRRAIFATYHFQLDEPDLRAKFFAHRRVHHPPANC